MGKNASTIKQEVTYGDTADVASRVKDGVKNKVTSVKGTMGDVVENIKGTTNDAADAIAGGSKANGGNQPAAKKLSATISKLNDGVAGKVADADVNAKTQRALGVAKENPIGLALAALALGFLSGSLLPVSDVERERLGPIREKVVSQAQAATHDLVEAGKAVVAETAQSVVTSALSSAHTHGHDVIEAAKTRAEQA